MAYTLAAPCESRQSVNPPVEAPTSTHTAPRMIGSRLNASTAFSSFNPPRETNGMSSPASRKSASTANVSPAFSMRRSPAYTCPARMSARARSRDGASPRSTSSLSTRSLTRPATIEYAILREKAKHSRRKAAGVVHAGAVCGDRHQRRQERGRARKPVGDRLQRRQRPHRLHALHRGVLCRLGVQRGRPQRPPDRAGKARRDPQGHATLEAEPAIPSNPIDLLWQVFLQKLPKTPPI